MRHISICLGSAKGLRNVFENWKLGGGGKKPKWMSCVLEELEER